MFTWSSGSSFKIIPFQFFYFYSSSSYIRHSGFNPKTLSQEVVGSTSSPPEAALCSNGRLLWELDGIDVVTDVDLRERRRLMGSMGQCCFIYVSVRCAAKGIIFDHVF